MRGNPSYYYVELLRVVNTSLETLDDDLKKLCEYIRHRASLSKDVVFYVLNYAEKNNVGGLVIISGDDASRVKYEVDLLIGFIESSLSSIRARIIRPKHVKTLPIPVSRKINF
ncbi:MAG: hypothetical protein ABWW65_04705 [Thermoprotei archaeon]